MVALAATCLLAHGAWADYVQLPMIEADGGQLVPTNFKLDSSDIIEVKFKTGSDLSGNQNIFCNRKDSTHNAFTFFLIAGTPRWDYGATASQNSADAVAEADTTYVIKCNGATGEWMVNGVRQEAAYPTPATFTTGGPLAFFSSYSSGDATGTTYTGGNNNAKVTFYYAKIWASDGTTLRHHLVPACDTAFSVATKKYGLLDIVPAMSVFYENIGSRAFKFAGDANIVWMGSATTLLSDSANWFGNSGSMVFVSDASATLASDWTAALGDGKMKMKADGAKVTLDIGAANTLSLTNHFYVGVNDATVEIVSGTVTNALDQNFYVGNEGGGYNGTTLDVAGATLVTKGSIVVGNGGGASDNAFVANEGSSVYADKINVGVGIGTNNLFLVQGGAEAECYSGFEIGKNYGTNNELRVTGRGTQFSQSRTETANSYIGLGSSSVSNRMVVADHATAYFGRALLVGAGCSHGLLQIESGGIVTNKGQVYIGHNNGAKNGKSARVVVTGEGSEWSTWNCFMINGTGDDSDAHELFVGDGANFVANNLSFSGNGNRLVVSNATATTAYLYTTNRAENVVGAENTTIRIEGANAKLTATHLNGTDRSFFASDIIEFVIPPNGWNEAPFSPSLNSISIPSGVTLRVDADSVKAYLKANPAGGTIPLMRVRTGGSPDIAVEDMAALSANLPNGCSLVNESGVLSVKIKSSLGFIISFR